MYDFNPQGLANTAWAFATMCIQAPELIQRAGAAASLLIEQFDPVDLLKYIAANEQAASKDESWAVVWLPNSV